MKLVRLAGGGKPEWQINTSFIIPWNSHLKRETQNPKPF